MTFQLKSDYQPAGDQQQAIEKLTQGVLNQSQIQVLLGVTGSGKTFTMANVIQNLQRPVLIITHNKTLAGQLYQEFRDYFPDNAVSYFVSYYDYYQPEAYIPQTDTYIEKETDINEEIDKLRLASTTHLLTRKDIIVVASVSCIYNLGSPIEYAKNVLTLTEGMIINVRDILIRLNDLQYQRSDYGFHRGTYRVRGEIVDIFLAYQDMALRVEFSNNIVSSIVDIDPLTGDLSKPDNPYGDSRRVVIYPTKHYLTDPKVQHDAFTQIETDLQARVKQLQDAGRIIEAHRIKQKITYDLEMIREVGYVNGIENYSRYFDGRQPGDPPFTLLDYFNHDPFELEPKTNNQKLKTNSRDWLCILDESHITIPQIRGMYNGDQARKQTLIDFGFRLPSALDNRPLKFEEFSRRLTQMVCVSATPGEWEISQAINSASSSPSTPPLSSRRKASPQPDRGPGSMASNKSEAEDLTSFSSKTPTMDPDLHRDDHKNKRLSYLDIQSNPAIVQQLIRPTGLVDPEVEIRPTLGQIADLLSEIKLRTAQSERVLVTTLTKRMAEELADYLEESGVKVRYLHSEITTLDRMDILQDLRSGQHDVVVGINLLREGLDLPEVSLVAILDADKEGFLRSETSLIQTMGRAARHLNGRVIMYADKITDSMQRAIEEVRRRRQIQLDYNAKHNITPLSIHKPIREKMIDHVSDDDDSPYGFDNRRSRYGQKQRGIGDDQLTTLMTKDPDELTPEQRKSLTRDLRKHMNEAAKNLNFELAARLRDKIKQLK